MSSQPLDHYELLGICKDADAETIKRRFRKLARECHPDVTGDDPVAAERFTKIREAYETLIDPQRRAVYDAPPEPRTFYRRSWRPPGGHHFEGLHNNTAGRSADPHRARNGWRDASNGLDLDDIFSDFGSADRAAKQRKTARHRTARPPQGAATPSGEDIRLPVKVSARVAAMGGTITLNYARLRRSERGDALFRYNEIYDLRIPPQTCSGQTMRIPRMGSAGAAGGAYGDLICEITVLPESHSQQQRSAPEATATSGADLDVPISITEALLGGRVQVGTPGGRVWLSIPPCSSSGRRMRLRGRGAGGADFYVKLRIVVPDQLDAESRQLISRFGELNPDSPRQ